MILRTTLSFLLIFALVFPVLAASKQVDDNVLYDTVKRKLANDQLVKGGNLDVDVKSGVVTIKGSVEYDNQKARAEKLKLEYRYNSADKKGYMDAYLAQRFPRAASAYPGDPVRT